MSEGSRTDDKALLDFVLEQQQFVLRRLGQAADSLARMAAEQDRQARLLTALSDDVRRLSSRVDAAFRRRDGSDRQIDTHTDHERTAHSDLALNGDQVDAAPAETSYRSPEMQALVESMRELERRFGPPLM